MASAIHLEATELERTYYTYDYDETDFEKDVARLHIEGVNFPTLCKIFRGEMPDQPISVGGENNPTRPQYAADFFGELIRGHAIALDEGVHSYTDLVDGSWEDTLDVR